MAKPKKPATDATAPKQEPNAINAAGLKAQALVAAYAAQIGPRLTPAFLASFASDLTALVSAVPAVITTHAGQRQLTAAQTTALARAYRLVKGVKATVKGQNPAKDVLLAYGVGTNVGTLSVSQVTAAVQKILDRVGAQPAEAASFDIIPLDIQGLKDAKQAIKDADAAQETARATAPQSTAQRNATARRILAGIKRIAGAGMRACIDDPTGYAKFEALINKAAG